MKNKYVVAYMTFFDNDLSVEIVEADSELEAACDFIKLHGFSNKAEDYKDLAHLKDTLFDSDCVIEVKHVI